MFLSFSAEILICLKNGLQRLKFASCDSARGSLLLCEKVVGEKRGFLAVLDGSVL